METWTLLKTPPDGDCGFHAISLAMRIFYKNKFPFLTNNERENVKIIRQMTIDSITKEIVAMEEKFEKYDKNIITALKKSLAISNYKAVLQDIVDKKSIPYNVLTSIRGELSTLEKIKERRNSLIVNPKEWLQDNDLIFLKDTLDICFSICEKNIAEEYTLWTVQVPKTCSGDNDYITDCFQKVPIIYLITSLTDD